MKSTVHMRVSLFLFASALMCSCGTEPSTQDNEPTNSSSATDTPQDLAPVQAGEYNEPYALIHDSYGSESNPTPRKGWKEAKEGYYITGVAKAEDIGPGCGWCYMDADGFKLYGHRFFPNGVDFQMRCQAGPCTRHLSISYTPFTMDTTLFSIVKDPDPVRNSRFHIVNKSSKQIDVLFRLNENAETSSYRYTAALSVPGFYKAELAERFRLENGHLIENILTMVAVKSNPVTTAKPGDKPTYTRPVYH